LEKTEKGNGAAARRAAIFAIAAWLPEADRPDVRGALVPDGIAPEGERGFVQDIVYTAVRRRRAIDFALGGLVRRMPRGETLAALYAGAAQILFGDGKIPDFAAVNETVAAAKASGRGAASFVNAVLRNMIRGKDGILAGLAAKPLAVRESFPDALVRRWTERFGAERAEALCKSLNVPAATYLAYPPPRGFEKLPRGVRVESVPGYAEGAFVVQDPATAAAVELLDVRPGLRTLDFCAAPGGKTAQIFWRLGGGTLVAAEPNAARRARLGENMRRVARGSSSVSVVETPPEGALFDRVLADVPCSNTGVLRRRPDARWRWSEKKLRSLAALQREILDRAAAFVAPGGILVYSTCSVEPEENREAVESFLSSRGGFRVAGEKASLPDGSGSDGAYACALARIA